MQLVYISSLISVNPILSVNWLLYVILYIAWADGIVAKY